ncbi:TadA family conjugal transfer-associated ATPase [Cellulomonas gilvus]|uniref:Type II secretion system protein E n=1 Tax=Cellulomonas gilvus (strain ATCC 13127 / NRRL B-14078) TaxID=593907 RepID=F8A3D4_CELGA|nr:type II secretion system protein E [Cellulomonas gilvus ATCC 13127]
MSVVAGHGVDDAFVDAVRERARGLGPASDDAWLRLVVDVARARGAVLGSAALAATARRVRAAIVGAGPLQALLEDPLVTDVLVNGPRDVWVERDGRLVRTGVDLGSDEDVRALAVRLAAAGGQRLDDAAPTADARLPDGTRLHAVLPPVAGAGTLLSLRVVRTRALSVGELVASGTLAPGVVPVVRDLVERRANLLVSGATGSGKTTLLAALLSWVGHDERIVVIEEAGELMPAHPHVVRLLARRANVDGAGRVDLAELVRQALRMRPDRIVLGECRGAEVREVMAALNTGHDGGCATVHANTAADVPARLEALAALAGLSRDAVAAQAAAAFDAVLHLRRDGPGRGRRFLAEIGVVRRGPGGLEVHPALTVSAAGAVERGPGWARLIGAGP